MFFGQITIFEPNIIVNFDGAITDSLFPCIVEKLILFKVLQREEILADKPGTTSSLFLKDCLQCSYNHAGEKVSLWMIYRAYSDCDPVCLVLWRPLPTAGCSGFFSLFFFGQVCLGHSTNPLTSSIMVSIASFSSALVALLATMFLSLRQYSLSLKKERTKRQLCSCNTIVKLQL